MMIFFAKVHPSESEGIYVHYNLNDRQVQIRSGLHQVLHDVRPLHACYQSMEEIRPKNNSNGRRKTDEAHGLMNTNSE